MSTRHRQIALDLYAEAARAGQLGGGRLRVRGDCMAPLLVDGDEVQLAAPGERPPRPGQIVLARLGGELLCHRLLAASGGHCQLAGDTDLRLDRVPQGDLLGTVTAISTPRFGGARLELPVRPSVWESWLAGWLLWSCSGRGPLERRLEGLRRRLLALHAARRWRQAQPSRPSDPRQ